MRANLTTPACTLPDSLVRKVRLPTAVMLAVLLACCSSLEKKVNLNYRTAVHGLAGTGEVYLARPVIQQREQVLPGGRVVLGSVKEKGTQIVTEDNISLWVADALAGELKSAGYQVKSVPTLPAGVPRGVFARVSQLSCGQTDDGLLLTTTTSISLAADVWKDGRLLKTVTASASSQDQGLDRSGDFVAVSLRKTLQLAMQELLPGIADAF